MKRLARAFRECMLGTRPCNNKNAKQVARIASQIFASIALNNDEFIPPVVADLIKRDLKLYLGGKVSPDRIRTHIDYLELAGRHKAARAVRMVLKQGGHDEVHED